MYSKRNQPDLMIKRGIKLIITALIVNFGKYFIPYFFAGYFLGNWNYISIFGGLLIFFTDVLFFAALSFILLGIFKKFNFSLKQILIIAILMSVIGSFIRGINFNNDVLNFIFGHFIGTGIDYTSFPL